MDVLFMKDEKLQKLNINAQKVLRDNLNIRKVLSKIKSTTQNK